MVRPFQELDVWQAAHAHALDIYEVTKRFPTEERYGLVSQMRRAAVSVPANIAEGSVRGDAEFRQFLRVALGSASEVEYFLILSRDLGYLSSEQARVLIEPLKSVKRRLVSFRNSLQPADSDGQPKAKGQRPTARSASYQPSSAKRRPQ